MHTGFASKIILTLTVVVDWKESHRTEMVSTVVTGFDVIFEILVYVMK
mgnify:CR=1 FL=1